ncbi:MAG: dynamin family protein [Anaerolineales bacterium]
MHILTDEHENLLNQERALLEDLRAALAKFGTTSEDEQTLRDSIEQLDDFFLLVVVGEFNAGKSAFINALLGQSLLKEGVTPTTAQINLLRYAERANLHVENEHLHIITAPVPLLNELSIVDTPGTNAIVREHEQITARFVPRADLVLFITSADRPFTESERTFLQQIRDWGKKIVIVLNKVDILQNESELEEIRTFIRQNAQTLLGLTPEIFPVSARLALQAKQGQPHLWQKSQFEALETYIHDNLDQLSRLRLKLLNPLGVGLHLSQRYLSIIAERLSLLQADVQMLADVESQSGIYRADMQRAFDARMAQIDNILLEMDQRGQDYFDQTIQLGRVFDLLDRERIQREFEQQVVGDVAIRIEQRLTELIDWLVQADLHQWQAITEHIAERRRQHKERLIGEPGPGTFHYDRERLMESVNREAQQTLETYDKTREAELIAENTQNAVAAAAAIEVGALGLGALITAIASTAAADFTGILLASAVAVIGLFVIPNRRRNAKQELRNKINTLRANLLKSLRSQFEHEMQRSHDKLQEGIAPYTRFVRAERGKLTGAQTAFEQIHTRIKRLQSEIERFTAP